MLIQSTCTVRKLQVFRRHVSLDVEVLFQICRKRSWVKKKIKKSGPEPGIAYRGSVYRTFIGRFCKKNTRNKVYCIKMTPIMSAAAI